MAAAKYAPNATRAVPEDFGGPYCTAQATVHADPAIAKGQAGILVCSLPPDHTGRLHYDGADEIWWSRDDEEET